MNLIRRFFSLSGIRFAAAMAFAVSAGPAWASESARATTSDELALHEPLPLREDPAGAGTRLGAFLLFPVLGVSETYDDNIFAARDRRKHDFVTVVAPSLIATLDRPAEYVRLNVGGHTGHHKMHASENFADGYASAEGRADLSPTTRIFGGAWLGRDHEERESPDEVFGREPTLYFDLQGYGGVRQQFGPVSVRIGGRVERLDFHDTRSTSGEINNDDRDRTLVSGGARIAVAIVPEFETFAQVGVDARRYDAATDDIGFARDSNGRRLALGARLSPRPDFYLQAFAGLMSQDYDDARLKDVHRPQFGGNLSWQAAPGTWLGALLDRTVGETTLADASATVDTVAALTLRREMGERFVLQARAGAGQSRFAGIGREDDVVFAGATLTWRIGARMSLIGEYYWTGQTSTVDGEAYRRNRAMIGVEGRF